VRGDGGGSLRQRWRHRAAVRWDERTTDTLKLSRRLEGAGMERKLAQELADGLADGLKERVATRGDLETFH